MYTTEGCRNLASALIEHAYLYADKPVVNPTQEYAAKGRMAWAQSKNYSICADALGVTIDVDAVQEYIVTKSKERIQEYIDQSFVTDVNYNTISKVAIYKGKRSKPKSVKEWLYRAYGPARKCQMCGAESKVRKSTLVGWKNISGEYKRDIKDWIQICRQCKKQT